MITEIVVALLMIVNGEIKEHRIQDSMSICLKAKRIALRSGTSRIAVSYTHLTLPTNLRV